MNVGIYQCSVLSPLLSIIVTEAVTHERAYPGRCCMLIIWYFVGRMLGTGQGGEKCYGKAKGEVNPNTQGKTTSLK